MEREKLESILIDYIDGRLNEADKQVIEQELKKNEDAYRLYEQLKEVIHTMDHATPIEPSPRLKLSFDEMISKELAASKQTKTIFFQPAFYRVAASVALLIIGGATGFWINQYVRQQDEIARLKHDLEKTKELMMSRLENQQSPSQRILGVLTANDISEADDEIVGALIRTMNEDPNSNVRLAAIEALKKFHHEPKVRKALISALSTQTDPVIQMALIQLMVEMKEKQAVRPLQRIIDDQEALQVVKDEAYAGIFKLS